MSGALGFHVMAGLDTAICTATGGARVGQDRHGHDDEAVVA
jgi:hypothetical protein